MGSPATTSSGAPAKAERTARRAADSDALDKLARLGIIAKALLWALVAILALQVASGDSEEADQQGALQQVAEQPLGGIVLWLMVAGFASYAVWRFSEAIWGRREEGDARKRAVKRVGSAADGLLYLAIGVLALRTVAAGSPGRSEQQSTVAKVLDWPAGEALVIAAGVAVVVGAIALTIHGLRSDFEKQLDTAAMSRGTFVAVRLLGQIGYVARGLVFGVLGYLLIKAAFEHEPGKADGLDAALKNLASAPFGRSLLLAVAAGLLCYAAYVLAESRYRRLDPGGTGSAESAAR